MCAVSCPASATIGANVASLQVSDAALHYIDLSDVNAGLEGPMSRPLTSILPNESASPGNPLRAVVEPFLDAWRAGMLDCQARAASLKGQATSEFDSDGVMS